MRWFGAQHCRTRGSARSAANLASGIESERYIPVALRRAQRTAEKSFVASWKGSGRCESPNTFQTIAHHPPGRSSLATFVKASVLSYQWNAVALTPRSKLASGNTASSKVAVKTVSALSGMVLRRKVARRSSGSTAISGFAPSSSNRRVAVPVPAPISNVTTLGARPHRSRRTSNTQSG